jgi:hypothetical protein
MASEDLNLTGIKSLQQALERTPNGAAAVELAKRLGIWSTRSHAAPGERPPFSAKLSELEPPRLSNVFGAWTAEMGRITELCGAVSAQDAALKIELKSAQARARSRVRREREKDKELKPLSAAALNDEADEAPEVLDLYERAMLLTILDAHAKAAKEATAQYLATISREIAFRDAQMKAGIY